MDALVNRVLDHKYKVIKKLSQGSFGQVYQGTDLTNFKQLAIKIEMKADSMQTLEREIFIYRILQGVKGIPQLYHYGWDKDFEFMVLEQMGNDLGHYFKKVSKFSLQTVSKIAIILIDILQRIHAKGVVHRDLKPENIMTGIQPNSNDLFLIDFGISKKILDNKGKHMKFKDGKPFLGTARYASIAAHDGFEVSRKDDIQSLGYILVYFAKGFVPWQNLKYTEKTRLAVVGNKKKDTTLTELCKGLPSTFVSFFTELKTYKFADSPNYKALKDFFEELLDEKLGNNDFHWDWYEAPKIASFTNLESLNSKKTNNLDIEASPKNNELVPVRPNIKKNSLGNDLINLDFDFLNKDSSMKSSLRLHMKNLSSILVSSYEETPDALSSTNKPVPEIMLNEYLPAERKLNFQVELLNLHQIRKLFP